MDVVDRRRGRRARLEVQRRELAQQVTGAAKPEHDLRAAGGDPGDLHDPAADEVDAIGLLARAYQDVAGREEPGLPDLLQCALNFWALECGQNCLDPPTLRP